MKAEAFFSLTCLMNKWCLLKDFRKWGWMHADRGKMEIEKPAESFSLKIKLLNLLNNFTTRQHKKCAIALIQEGEIRSNNASNVLRAVITWSDTF